MKMKSSFVVSEIKKITKARFFCGLKVGDKITIEHSSAWPKDYVVYLTSQPEVNRKIKAHNLDQVSSNFVFTEC